MKKFVVRSGRNTGRWRPQAAPAAGAPLRPVAERREKAFIRDWMPGSGIEDYVVSATIEAIKSDV